jgi:hypothetical protein
MAVSGQYGQHGETQSAAIGGSASSIESVAGINRKRQAAIGMALSSGGR